MACCVAVAQVDEPVTYVEHTVAAGDTVFQIALRYGSSVRRIVRENAIGNVRRLQVGSRLRISVVTDLNPASAQRLRARQVADHTHSIASANQILSRANDEIRAARYEQALASGAEAIAQLADVPDEAANPLRAKLEVVRAIAYVALADTEASRRCMERALVADPMLTFDPVRTSPKVLAIFHLAEQSVTPR